LQQGANRVNQLGVGALAEKGGGLFEYVKQEKTAKQKKKVLGEESPFAPKLLEETEGRQEL